MTERAIVPILFLDHAPAIGGAEQSLLLLLRHLNKTRWQPILGCVDGELRRQADALGVQTKTLDFPPLRGSGNPVAAAFSGSRPIARLITQTRARLVVGNALRATFYGALASKLSRTPFLWYMRDFWLSEAQPEKLWADGVGKLLFYSLSTRVIANSQATASHLPRKRKVSVVLNGIEVEAPSSPVDRDWLRSEYGIPPSRLIVGMAGRLRRWKGQETFLRVAAQALLKNDNLHFVLIGGEPFKLGGDYAAELQEMAARLGITSHVTFTGHLKDVRPALASLDVFVHPGDPEPFGLVNLEAMAAGKPVVAFAHGALPEIVVPGETGILVPPGDLAALTEAILNLSTQPEERLRMGANGRRRLEEHFSIQRTVAELDAIFTTLVQR